MLCPHVPSEVVHPATSIRCLLASLKLAEEPGCLAVEVAAMLVTPQVLLQGEATSTTGDVAEERLRICPRAVPWVC